MPEHFQKYLNFNNVLLIAATILALSWAWATIGALNKNYGLEQEINQAQLETDILRLQNENLKLEQTYYQTDEYLELQARALLNKSLDGEHLVVLPKIAAHENPESENSGAIDKSNFEKWMDFLFGRKT